MEIHVEPNSVVPKRVARRRPRRVDNIDNRIGRLRIPVAGARESRVRVVAIEDIVYEERELVSPAFVDDSGAEIRDAVTGNVLSRILIEIRHDFALRAQ